MPKKLTQKEFLDLAVKKHNNIYDYRLINYINSQTPIDIICLKHGIFSQRPAKHLFGQGCPKCCLNYKLSLNQFINEANKKHKNKYDYSKVNYINNCTNIIIICSIHGEFIQQPQHHLNGSGCQYCSNRLATKGNNLAILYPELIKEWDFNRNININPYKISPFSNKKVWWKCYKNKKHSWRSNISSRTYKKANCPFCSHTKIELKNSLYYKYSSLLKEWNFQKNIESPSKIFAFSNKKYWWICKNNHEWQATINNRSNGSRCPICYHISKGEEKIKSLLEKQNIQYQYQFKFNDCKNKRPLPFDFAIFKQKKLIGLIEYQGKQHFHKVKFDKKSSEVELEKKLKYIQNNDRIKNNFCKNKNIPLLILSYKDKSLEEKINQFYENTTSISK